MKNKKILILIALVLMISLVGITYAFFEYYGVSADYVVSAGEVTLTFNEGTDTIDLTNIFPETKEEARERDDNVITFTVSGVNTTENKDIWYEIMLNEGDEEAGLIRFLPKELMFDLTEINPDGTKKLVVDNMNFGEFDDTRIWVNTILKDNETTFTRTYELRMWLSDKVLISDTVENADYTTSEFRQRYASVKVSVFGDFNEKSAPYNYLAKINTSSFAFWPTSINNVRSSISEVNFVSLSQEEIDTIFEAAPIKEDVTDTSKGGSVLAWLESDTTDNTKYIMYVASNGITYLPSSSDFMFYGFNNLKEVWFNNVNTGQVEDMSSMFRDCSKLTNLDISHFDTSKVVDMGNMFQNCSSLTNIDVSDFDTNQLTEMVYMFSGCSKLTNLDVSNLDTSNVTSFASMFSGCSSLTNIDVSSFDTSNVTSFASMFSGCSSLTNIDVSGFDTSQATDIGSMFYNCSSLITLDVGGFDTSKVTRILLMFYGCSSLTNLDVSGFDTHGATSMQGMFYNCSSLVNLDVSGFDTSSVKVMAGSSSDYGMFAGCSSLVYIDVSNFDTSQLTTMANMFRGCSSLTSLDVSGFDTGGVTDMSYMFNGCSSLINLDVSGFDTGQVKNMTYMFNDCSNLTTIYSDSDWNIESVTNSKNMFRDCSKLVGAVPYDSSKTDITMANPNTGYFTVKPAEETPAA